MKLSPQFGIRYIKGTVSRSINKSSLPILYCQMTKYTVKMEKEIPQSKIEQNTGGLQGLKWITVHQILSCL